MPGRMTSEGRISKVSGPTVVAKGMREARMFNRVIVGEAGLLGEVIRLRGDEATVQVFEDSTGLSLGEKVTDLGGPLLAELGPGLLGTVFDGVQRPLSAIREGRGDFISTGVTLPALDREKRWEFRPAVERGKEVRSGDVVGTVQETARCEHRILVPPGRGGRVVDVHSGSMTLTDPAVVLDDGPPLSMLQRWPVRIARPFQTRLPPTVPFITGQRVLDVLFPLALGGAAMVPGGFGTGKTVVEQSLARYADADIILFIGCGERGNEMTEVLTDFPRLTDPATGRPLMERTVLIVNTSNMPVAAREASLYTGITIAEYYRDMGYRVALMADSISRWAEALREISSRLEEMPGEEGYPTYLASRLAGFYERGGRVACLGHGAREGTLTLVSAVSPPGGDFSEPVTQSGQRIAGALWALDADLAQRRHFPAVNWKRSYSLYVDVLQKGFGPEEREERVRLRSELMLLLQREEEVQEIVQLVGVDALQDRERLLLMTTQLIREEFLRQSAYSEHDAFCPPEKGYGMLKVFLGFHALCRDLLEKGVGIERILTLPLREELGRMKESPAAGFDREVVRILERMSNEREEH